MPNPSIDDAEVQRRLDALARNGGNKIAAAAELGVPSSQIYTALRLAARRGMDGYAKAPVPEGYSIKGHSTYYDRNGEVLGQWVKTTRDPASTEAIIDGITAALERFKGMAVVPPKPKHADEDLAVIYPRPDLHVGMMAWGEETGVNWDLKKAIRVYEETSGHLVASAPPAETALVLGLGDFYHADDSKNATPSSGNALDVDGRYPKVLEAGTWLEVGKVQLALSKHRRVVYKALPGNHDPHSAIALGVALKLFFHGEPRVTVDTSPAMRWYWRHGTALIGATHGHTVKQTDLAMCMANDRPQDWAECQHRRFYTGHRHHKAVIEHGGVICEQFQSPAPKDAYHAAGPWVSGRGMTAITFHRTRGEISRMDWAL